jgi:hypothetical protein
MNGKHQCLFFGFGILFALLCSPICNGQVASNETSETQTTPAPGDVNLDFSRVYIFVDKSGLVGHEHAVEGRLKAGSLFTQQARSGTLVFDMTTFDADSDTARKALRLSGSTDADTRSKVNENMLGAEILNVKKYPEAKLENAVLTPTGKTTARRLPEYQLEGDFTLHSTRRHVIIPCEVEEKNGWHHVRGSFKILQSDYGIKPFSKMLGAVGVKDELVIIGDLWVAPAP